MFASAIPGLLVIFGHFAINFVSKLFRLEVGMGIGLARMKMAESMDLQGSSTDKEPTTVKTGTEGPSTSNVAGKKRACIICLGMAGSGKTTFVQVSHKAVNCCNPKELKCHEMNNSSFYILSIK